MKSKNVFLWIAIIVVIVLVVWYLKPETLQNVINQSSPKNQSNESTTVKEGESPEANLPVYSGQQSSTFTQTQIQTYSDLVKQYGDKRVQFDERCQMRPADVTFKNGTMVMFDNRSDSAKTIRVGDRTFNFPAYGYKILTLSSSTVPSNLTIGCGAALDVGKILLQANILGE